MLVEQCEMGEKEVQYRSCQLAVSTEHRVETLGGTNAAVRIFFVVECEMLVPPHTN